MSYTLFFIGKKYAAIILIILLLTTTIFFASVLQVNAQNTTQFGVQVHPSWNAQIDE